MVRILGLLQQKIAGLCFQDSKTQNLKDTNYEVSYNKMWLRGEEKVDKSVHEMYSLGVGQLSLDHSLPSHSGECRALS